MAGKDRVESASTIADWILLALLMMTKTVASFCHKSETFRKHLIFPACTHFLIFACFPIYTNCDTFCKNNHCIQIDINEIVKFYPNLLIPIKNISNQIEYGLINSLSDRKNINSDSDECCPTSRSFYIKNTLKNLHGIERRIVKTEDLVQLIPVGSCFIGNCQTCVPRYRTISILVIDFNRIHNLPVEFDQFEVPIYCICFNTIRK